MDIFRERNGKLSFGRVIGTIILIWAMSLSTYISIEKKDFVDFPEWAAIIIIGLYGINKAAEVGHVYAKRNNNEDDI